MIADGAMEDRPRRTRAVNNDLKNVRTIIEKTMTRFDGWRDRVALLQAQARRPAPNRRTLLAGCADIRAQILDARTELIFDLAESPARIAGHGRIVDIERALDSLEAALQQIEAAVRSSAGSPFQ